MSVALDGCDGAAADLMTVDDADCGPEWLAQALQLAVTLELATIPVYSCGLWSIKDPRRDAGIHRAIRDIIFDEMSHFGLVGNVLSAIGGTPVLSDPAVVPTYPGPLPGGLQPGLTVHLAGLDRRAAEMYSRMEMPDRPAADRLSADRSAADRLSDGAPVDGRLSYGDPADAARLSADRPSVGGTPPDPDPDPDPDTHTSISAFYGRVRTALRRNRQLFGRDPGPQMDIDLSRTYGGGAAITPVRTWEEADAAIEVITAQSEGDGTSPDNPLPGRPGDLAHYYVFREIHHGRRLVRNTTGTTPAWDYTGPPVPMPEAHPMSRVPAGGWANDPVNAPSGAVAVLLDEFDAHYSSILRTLEAVWRTPGRARQYALMADAARSMGNMRTLARVLVRIPLPDGSGTYGPEFRHTEREP